MNERRKWRSIAVCAAGALTLISVVDAGGFRRYFRLEKEAASLEQKSRDFEHSNRALEAQIEALRSDPRELERVVREELGYTKPGEVILHLE